jgi:hypothetical protein
MFPIIFTLALIYMVRISMACYFSMLEGGF